MIQFKELKDEGRLEFTYKYSHLSPAKVYRIKNTPDCVIDNSRNPTPRSYWLLQSYTALLLAAIKCGL